MNHWAVVYDCLNVGVAFHCIAPSLVSIWQKKSGASEPMGGPIGPPKFWLNQKLRETTMKCDSFMTGPKNLLSFRRPYSLEMSRKLLFVENSIAKVMRILTWQEINDFWGMIGTYYYRSIGRSESQGGGGRIQGLLKEKVLFLTEEIQYHDGLRSRELGQAPILLCGPNS